MNFYHICVTLGLFALLHAAYSAAQRVLGYPVVSWGDQTDRFARSSPTNRAYLRLTEQEFTGLPWDILVQCLAALLLTIFGVVHIAGNFKEIRASADIDHKTWDMLSNRQGFYSFHHRGKALYQPHISQNG